MSSKNVEKIEIENIQMRNQINKIHYNYRRSPAGTTVAGDRFEEHCINYGVAAAELYGLPLGASVVRKAKNVEVIFAGCLYCTYVVQELFYFTL